MRKNRIFAIVMAILMMGTMAFAQPLNPAEVGDMAPDFTIQLIDGEEFKLSDYRGKVVYLNIWATWCPPCVAEMPDIEKLANAYPDDLVVIGVSCDQDAETVKQFVEENGYTYNFAHDATYLITGLLYPSYYIPNSVFIGPDGVISSMISGGANYETMEAHFLKALGNAEETA